MVAQPESLEFVPFGPSDPLASLGTGTQVQYLRRYFHDLQAKSVVREKQYFDRDYLSEFSAFYSTSCAGYKNTCERLHFFSCDVGRDVFLKALTGDDSIVKQLSDTYLGFVVVRPMPQARLGRTVVRWYPEQTPNAPRVTSPSRDYAVCIAGLCLEVRGLAWQQQDSAVGACATIALWSMLHSSGLRGFHALPCTADVTRAAHRNSPFGHRVFPSNGLNIYQLCEAIKEHGLSPVLIPGEVGPHGRTFNRERFCASTSALIRSGFPVILSGSLDGEGHAVCAVGFRATAVPPVAAGAVVHHDRDIPNVYIHDDNLGPSVRFKILDKNSYVSLKPEPPPLATPTTIPDPTTQYPEFVPDHILAAVPDDIRTSPDHLHRKGLRVAMELSVVLAILAQAQGATVAGLSLSTRFMLLRDFLSAGVASALKGQPDLIGSVRIALAEEVRPMSLYLGVVRIGNASEPLLDILYDTTDSDVNQEAFCYIVYKKSIAQYAQAVAAGHSLGRPVPGYAP